MHMVSPPWLNTTTSRLAPPRVAAHAFSWVYSNRGKPSVSPPNPLRNARRPLLRRVMGLLGSLAMVHVQESVAFDHGQQKLANTGGFGHFGLDRFEAACIER